MDDKRTWQEATLTTISRLRDVMDLASPKVKAERLSREAIYTHARLMAATMGATSSQFWNIYINAVRILIAVESEKPISQDQLF